MKKINIVYDTYITKVDTLYDKELTLNNNLLTLFNVTVSDIDLLNSKYKFQTNIPKLIEQFKTTYNKDLNRLLTNKNDREFRELLYLDCANPKYKLFALKIRILIITCIRLHHSTERLTYYKSQKMSYSTFNVLNSALNIEFTKSILRGYEFHLGLAKIKVGCLKVERVERRFDNNGIPTDKSVDWNESNKFKQILIEDGKTPYDKEKAPHGVQWFLYHTEPYIYYINWQVSMYAHKHMKLFKFNPTVFINTKNRINSDILDAPNVDVDSIISNSKLGFSNRLNILLKLDPSYGLKYE